MSWPSGVGASELLNAYFLDFIRSGSLITDLLIFFTVSGSVYYLMQKQFFYFRDLPPGPWGLPVVGYLPWLRGGAPHSIYVKLSEKYGDITSLTLGKNLVVCISSAKLIRELFNRPDSTSRPHTPLNNLLQGRGIVLSEGELWRRQRQFVNVKFQSLGVSMNPKQRFEKYVSYEIEEYLTTLKNLNGAPIDPVEGLGRHIHNIICQLMMSFRFQEGDEEFAKYNQRVSEGMMLYGSIHISEHIPAYLRLPGKAAVMKKIESNLDAVATFHRQKIQARRLSRTLQHLGKSDPEDLLDHYLNEIDGKHTIKSFPGIKSKEEREKQIVQVMNDLFSAGMETSRTSIAWVYVMMLREPMVAKKVQDELATVLHRGELVTLEHQPRLPYLNAVLYETLRLVSVVPLGTTHVNAADWQVGGYKIPAGTHLIPLINKVHMDPRAFPEPEKFIPERFINEKGRFQVMENFLAFGVGRRKCLGQQLARVELVLFFANIMNNFELCLAEGEKTPELEGILGMTHAPKPFQMCFKEYEKVANVSNGNGRQNSFG